jgi:CBS domain containing-hemolysin-like protein
VTPLSFSFTIAYFVVVEAMSKTFGILHSASVALALAPVVWALGRALRVPTRLLIGLANVFAPRQGAEGGPFVTPRGDPLHGRGRP